MEVVELLQVEWFLGVGSYAQQRGRCALKEFTEWRLEVGMVTHPNPINPATNKDWSALATAWTTEGDGTGGGGPRRRRRRRRKRLLIINIIIIFIDYN